MPVEDRDRKNCGKRTPLSCFFFNYSTLRLASLNDRWACAACYLAALEIVVNKVCKAWNIRADSFEKKLEKVVRELRKRDENLSKVEKKLIKTIYDLRGKILHSGYIPNDEEYERIVADIPDFIEKVKKHIN